MENRRPHYAQTLIHWILRSEERKEEPSHGRRETLSQSRQSMCGAFTNMWTEVTARQR
ncbi:protein of unknown function (plasmid) [Acidithiobacillus ferrivorans]|nr:protein of unknown function [Acidithiobacillus ferrivorans]